MRLLIVMPAFNEAVALPALLAELYGVAAREKLDLDVVVIDDASKDQTAEVARRSGARVVQLCRNLGIGGAVQTGLRLAAREGFDAAVQMDGDGQHPPAELRKLIEALQATPMPDIVIGSRYLEQQGFQSTWLRRAGIAWLRWVVKLLTRRTVTDPTSGYRVYGRRALKLFARTYPHDYPEPEVLVLARTAGLTVKEVPVIMKARQGGQSSIRSFRAPYYVFKVTAALVLAFLRRHDQIDD